MATEVGDLFSGVYYTPDIAISIPNDAEGERSISTREVIWSSWSLDRLKRPIIFTFVSLCVRARPSIHFLPMAACRKLTFFVNIYLTYHVSPITHGPEYRSLATLTFLRFCKRDHKAVMQTTLKSFSLRLSLSN